MSNPEPFKPTHTIIDGNRRISVHECDSVLYTRVEWDAEAAADWELNDGVLTFQGEPRGRLEPIGVDKAERQEALRTAFDKKIREKLGDKMASKVKFDII